MRKNLIIVILLTILLLTACKQDDPVVIDPVNTAADFIESASADSDEFNRIYDSLNDENKTSFTGAVLFQHIELHGMDNFVTDVLFTKHSATYN